jgi:aspartate/methionine/tyrosine aminotransferase
MQYAIVPALTGDRSHQRAFADALRVRAEITTRRISAIAGMRCVMPRAAFYAMPQVDLPDGCTDQDYVLGLLRATGNLCVYGSGFGMPADQGFFRIVYLATPDVLNAIYDEMAVFTQHFLERHSAA